MIENLLHFLAWAIFIVFGVVVIAFVVEFIYSLLKPRN